MDRNRLAGKRILAQYKVDYAPDRALCVTDTEAEQSERDLALSAATLQRTVAGVAPLGVRRRHRCPLPRRRCPSPRTLHDRPEIARLDKADNPLLCYLQSLLHLPRVPHP